MTRIRIFYERNVAFTIVYAVIDFRYLLILSLPLRRISALKKRIVGYSGTATFSVLHFPFCGLKRISEIGKCPVQVQYTFGCEIRVFG